MTRPVTLRLAEYASATGADALPPAVLHEALRCVVNFIGCAIGGTDHDVVRAMTGALLPFAGSAGASLIGQRRRCDALTAALVNGSSASAHSFDDTHAEAVVHAGAPVCSAALALAQSADKDGRSLLAAVALGVEATFRLSKAVSVTPAVGNIAWYQTGIAGGVGAAVAASKLLDLPAEPMRNAIGLAVATASGSRVMQGSMAMLMLAGHAAQSGLRAALLAQQGVESPQASLEGAHGFAAVFSAQPHLPWIDAGLGQRYEILSNTYKAYPCGVVLHPVVDACLELRAALGAPVEHIASIEVRVHPVALALTDRRHPSTRTEAQVSLHHWAATAIALGSAGLDEGKLPAIRDPGTTALRDRVQPVADEAFPRDAAQVTLRLASGATHASAVHRGCRPLDDAALERKLRMQAAGIVADADVDTLVRSLRQLPDARSLAALGECL